jgi:hypothetical protein
VCVRARNCALSRNLKHGGLGPSWAVVPQKNGNLNYPLKVSVQESVYTEKNHEYESGRRWVGTDCTAIQNRRIQCKV